MKRPGYEKRASGFDKQGGGSRILQLCWMNEWFSAFLKFVTKLTPGRFELPPFASEAKTLSIELQSQETTGL